MRHDLKQEGPSIMTHALLRGALAASLPAVLLLAASAAPANAQIAIGHLADYSGATADVRVPFGHGTAHARAYVNQRGGVIGTKVNVDSVDYGYQVPRAVPQYKKWVGEKVAAILGWGTADTEALTSFVAQDQIPYVSASYAAALTDPAGVSG